MPPFLYKYRPVNDYTKKCITDQELYFSNARSFNDPIDTSPIFSYDCTQEQFDEYSFRILSRIQPNRSEQELWQMIRNKPRDPKSPETRQSIKTSFESVLENVGILCLSETNDNILMWSHYADSHKGICFKFEVSEEIGFFTQAHKVRYQSNRPVCNLVTDDRDEMNQQAFLVKADDWSYEKEWRMLGLEYSPGTHSFPPELLKGIILGAKISDQNANLIRELIAPLNNDIELQQAQINPERFAIDIVDI